MGIVYNYSVSRGVDDGINIWNNNKKYEKTKKSINRKKIKQGASLLGAPLRSSTLTRKSRKILQLLGFQPLK